MNLTINTQKILNLQNTIKNSPIQNSRKSPDSLIMDSGPSMLEAEYPSIDIRVDLKQKNNKKRKVNTSLEVTNSK